MPKATAYSIIPVFDTVYRYTSTTLYYYYSDVTILISYRVGLKGCQVGIAGEVVN